jgi:hypothetical protein
LLKTALRALFRILCSAEAVFVTLFSPININSTARVELIACLLIDVILPKPTNEPFDASIPSWHQDCAKRVRRLSTPLDIFYEWRFNF